MKSIVIYYTESGNTLKLAQAIAGGMQCEARSIAEITPDTVAGYEHVCFCSPVQGMLPAARMLAFIEHLPPVASRQAVSAFTMHLFGADKAAKTIKKRLEGKGYEVIGSYACLGWSRLIANFGPRIFMRGHPNVGELEGARVFGANFSRNLQSIP